ncbi:hypothetical protein [Caenispirillum salinarum]|uniref:hypothetical protein n=1 Tax=Caenispirillum salinarum TaxID=859058 RepID=UPI00384C894C
MKIEQDPAHPGGGFARLVLPGKAGDARKRPRVTITRQSNSDSCLGHAGWQAAEHQFKPRKIRVEGSSLVLILGPEIVDNVDEFTGVTVSVPPLKVSEQLRWPSLMPATDLDAEGDGQNFVDDGAEPPIEYDGGAKPPASETPSEPTPDPVPDPKPEPDAVPRPGPAPQPKPTPEPKPEPQTAPKPETGPQPGPQTPGPAPTTDVNDLLLQQKKEREAIQREREAKQAPQPEPPVPQPEPKPQDGGGTVEGGDGEVETSPEPEKKPIPDPVPGPDPTVDPEQTAGKRRPLWPFILLIVVLLAALGGAAYAFRDEITAFVEDMTGAADADPAPGAGDTAPAEEAEPADADAAPAVDSSLSPAERYDMAMAALRAGDPDTAVPLLRANAGDGHAPSMGALAEHYADIDPGEALRLAADACEQGLADGAGLLDQVQSTITAQADRGDAMARLALDIDLGAAAAACAP